MTRLIDLYVLCVPVAVWLAAVFAVASLVDKLAPRFERGQDGKGGDTL